jgi:hypothetical protein
MPEGIGYPNLEIKFGGQNPSGQTSDNQQASTKPFKQRSQGQQPRQGGRSQQRSKRPQPRPQARPQPQVAAQQPLGAPGQQQQRGFNQGQQVSPFQQAIDFIRGQRGL